jgi:cytochrome c oxidase cbb3-type subunit 3
MVGVGRRDIAALSAWIGRLSPRARLLAAAGLAALAALIAWAVLNAQQEARLLRADPDALTTDAAATRLALGPGRATFRQNCASCHGPSGQGHPSWGVPNLTDKDWLYGEGHVSDIENVVRYGIRAQNSRTWRLADMPAFGRPQPYPREPAIKPLSPGDIGDVMQFLKSLRGAQADGDAAQRGAKIFADRGGCYDCHARDGRGDPAIGAPNLTDDIWLYGDGSDPWIYRSIAFGRGGVCPAWFDRMSPIKIREVALYVFSLSNGGSPPKPSLP